MPPSGSEPAFEGSTLSTVAASEEPCPPRTPWIAAAAGVTMHTLVTALRAPVAASFALSLFAFSFPAGLSVALLAAALPQLLISSYRTTAPPLLRVRPLLLVMAAWAFAAYLIGPVGAGAALPPLLRRLVCVSPNHPALAPFAPAITTLSFSFVLLCLAAHCHAHRVGALWPRVSPLTLSDPPHPRRTARVLAANIAVYLAGCVAIPLMWVAIISVRVSMAKASYVGALAVAVVIQQVRTPGVRASTVVPVLRMLPLSACAAVHACLLYATALTPPEDRWRWLRGLTNPRSNDGALSSIVQATVLLVALAATVGHSVLRQRLQASLGGPEATGARGGAVGRAAPGGDDDVSVPLLRSHRELRSSQRELRASRAAVRRQAEMTAEVAVWRRWTTAAETLARGNVATGASCSCAH